MLDLSHVVTLLLFIVIGGIGMASMQDGLGIVGRRLMMLFRRRLHNPRTGTVRPQTFMIMD
ncbi:hypothetical protein [Kordiimonas aestuarii]|uniref:hypothetical protein n=1 Tax=Kordiimonas aestuarii TaxID=1005925 RepID=UPI0021D1BB87|nr:hypothetical protein [Kordiimonas aestuarii]